jgi:hypothetical protein
MTDGTRPAIEDDDKVLRLHDLVSEEIRGQKQRDHCQARHTIFRNLISISWKACGV